MNTTSLGTERDEELGSPLFSPVTILRGVSCVALTFSVNRCSLFQTRLVCRGAVEDKTMKLVSAVLLQTKQRCCPSRVFCSG